MTTTAAIANIAAKLGALPGIKSAPVVPPEDAGVYPFGVTYEAHANTNTLAYGSADDLVTIFAEIHVSRVLLANAVTLAMSFRDPFLAALIADPSLGGTVSTTNEIRRSFGRLVWGDVETIGYRFEIDVKVTITVP